MDKPTQQGMQYVLTAAGMELFVSETRRKSNYFTN